MFKFSLSSAPDHGSGCNDRLGHRSVGHRSAHALRCQLVIRESKADNRPRPRCVDGRFELELRQRSAPKRRLPGQGSTQPPARCRERRSVPRASYLTTITGPITLVGHSYGGAVITNAATGNSQVRSLVYVDAYIPAEGETLGGLTHPPSIFAQDPANVLDFVPFPGAPAGVVDTYVKPSIYGEAFASERFSRSDVRVMAASQRPLSSQVFDEASGPPAWASIPSWAVVGEQDRAIPIADQVAMATNARSQIVRVDVRTSPCAPTLAPSRGRSSEQPELADR